MLGGVRGAVSVRRGRAGRNPLVELSVFARRSYTSGVLFVIVFFGAIVGFSLAVGMFLQLVLGYSPMKASLTMAGVGGGRVRRLRLRQHDDEPLGRHILHIGLALMLVGTGALYAVFQIDGLGVRAAARCRCWSTASGWA